jgi:hypothetical protein
MVARFKPGFGRQPVYDITQENVERFLGKKRPWLQQGRQRGEERNFAICPGCDTPIQLIGLYKQTGDGRGPYGSHTGGAVDGFTFELEDMLSCPYYHKNIGKDLETHKRKMGPLTRKIIDTAISEFDRIVLILQDGFGFAFSEKFVGRMINQWFDAEGYLYFNVSLRNLPWMFAYFSPAQNLMGQAVAENCELKKAIEEKVPQARFSGQGRLDKGVAWYQIMLQCLLHKINDSTGEEHMLLRVLDYTNTIYPEKAPLIYKKVINFDMNRFEKLINTPPERARRGEKWLRLIHGIATEREFT